MSGPWLAGAGDVGGEGVGQGGEGGGDQHHQQGDGQQDADAFMQRRRGVVPGVVIAQFAHPQAQAEQAEDHQRAAPVQEQAEYAVTG